MGSEPALHTDADEARVVESSANARRRTAWRVAISLLFLSAVLALAALGSSRPESRVRFLGVSLVPVVLAMGVGILYAGGLLVRRDESKHDLLIVGKNRRTREYVQAMDRFKSSSVRLVGILDPKREPNGTMPRKASDGCDDYLRGRRIHEFGSGYDLTRVLKEHPVSEVLITLPIKSFYDEIARCLEVCQVAGVPVSLSVNLFETNGTRPALVSWGGNRLKYSSVHHPRWALAAKRSIDFFGSLTGLILLAVPMLLIALAVKLTSRGPVFFSQRRAGLHHKPFKMLKFRTMVSNAEELRKDLDHLNEQQGPVFKIKNDPRITRIGRLLRKYSLDELPQLFNVLVGDMSLVGPRPPIPSEVVEYEWWQRRRLSAKPGLTCYWQVSGRNRIAFDDWMRLDLKYIDNWSLLLDLKLVLKTFPAVLGGRGAS